MDKGFLFLTQENGNDLALCCEEIQSVMEQPYGCLITTKNNKDYPVTETFANVYKQFNIVMHEDK